MSRKCWLLVSVLLVGCVQPVVPNPSPDPSPDDNPPTKSFGLESLGSTITDDAARAQLSAVCSEMSRLIVADGEIDEPALTTTKAVELMQARLTDYVYDGKKLTTEGYRNLLSETLTRELDTENEGRELDRITRKTAADIFQAAGYYLSQ